MAGSYRKWNIILMCMCSSHVHPYIGDCALENCLELPFLVLTFPGKYQNCFYSVRN